MLETTDRRKEIIKELNRSNKLIAGTKMADLFGVSRQVIVQDIAILKAEGYEIESTNRGYKLAESDKYKRVFKISHKDEDIEKELNSIVDLGATVKNVSVNHKVYGKIVVDMNIKSRRDVQKFLETIKSGISKPLKNLTESYHYHMILADNEEILDEVEEILNKKGFIVK